PNSLLTKAATNTKKITNFFKKSDTQDINQNTIEDTSNDSKSDIINLYTYQLTEKIKDLKEQLEK
ncbi:2753_t:CDS:1, partial [Funneliformis caledonium]